MATGIRKHCHSCNKIHQSKDDICAGCKRAAHRELMLAKAPFCAFCGKEKTIDSWSSPYCSWQCASSVVKISVACSGKVNRAIKDGLIAKLDGTIACVDCGKPADRYDHRDYTKPLSVDPVCPGCNVLRGPAHTMPLAA